MFVVYLVLIHLTDSLITMQEFPSLDLVSWKRYIND